MTNHRSQSPARVVLLHSNDLHSRLEQAAKMSAYIAEERRKVGADNLLVLDVGDHMDRMRLETEGSDGLVNIALLNEAGYDAVTLGNNEGLTYTRGELERAYAREARFPAVCANMTAAEDGKRPAWLHPAAVVRKGGLRFGIVGVTAAFSDFYSMLGWDVADPLAAAAEQVSRLRPQVDIVVVLSHLGLMYDRRMAEELDGVDLILGGHTHHLLEEPLVIGGTAVCAAGKFGDFLGRVEIAVHPGAARPAISASCVPMAAYAESREAAAIIGGFRAAGERRLGRVVARLAEPLAASAEREAPLGNLLAAGLRRWTDAELGIVNSGQLLGGLATGDVTAAQLHALCPSPINPCRMRLTGRAIRQALEEALLEEFVAMPIRGFGFRGSVLGTLAVDGLTVRYDPDGEPGSKIIDALVGEAPLSADRVYTVGTIDMFTFGIGYLSLKEGTDVRYYLPEFIRDVIAEELRSASSVGRAGVRRWHAVAPPGRPSMR